ncbi:T9SS type A sorting domain-containing protein [Flavobacterium salilacus subsp. salilacus]|uniref:Ig-like domain-containing protein n=1 Tax=Flavobacterium TaxID=237 RepID=UPI001074FB8B|nr:MULTISPECIES: T9SS type A sorting domain-containing protein [Flavobacterium]KAF2519493.1 T9SS type A sorting domain-containing protein [Flavobacterium salilacus subsp. salilacus]MBE1614610.1 T9SS type A sorting domain-containing protein [Flavobacterium sp. SaA2.13]
MMKFLRKRLFKKLLVIAFVMMGSVMLGQTPYTLNHAFGGPSGVPTGIQVVSYNGQTSCNTSQNGANAVTTLVLKALPGYQFTITSVTGTGVRSNAGSNMFKFQLVNNGSTINGSETNVGSSSSCSGGTTISPLSFAPNTQVVTENSTVTINIPRYPQGGPSGNGYSHVKTLAVSGVVTPTLPDFNLEGSSLAFADVCLDQPENGYFTFTGDNFSTNATIQVAALEGFTYSLTQEGTYEETLTISNYNGEEITVWVNFTPTVMQNYNGNIVLAGQGSDSEAELNIPVTGMGSLPASPLADAQDFCGPATIADLLPETPESPLLPENFAGAPTGINTGNYTYTLGVWNVKNTAIGSGQEVILFTTNPADAHIISPSFDGIQSITFDGMSQGTIGSTLSVIKIVNGVESLVTTVNLQPGTLGDPSGFDPYTVAINDPSGNIKIKLVSSDVPGETSNYEILKNIVFTGYPDVVYNWYDTATGGMPLAAGDALTTGNYYLSQTVDGCESLRTSVEITANDIPAAPTVDITQTLTSIATVENLNEGNAENAMWYTQATGGTALTDDTAVTAGTYYISQTVNGCESDRTAVEVTIQDPVLTLVSTNLNFAPVCLNAEPQDIVGSFTFTVTGNANLAAANIGGPGLTLVDGFNFGTEGLPVESYDAGSFYVEDIQDGQTVTVYVQFDPQPGMSYGNLVIEVTLVDALNSVATPITINVPIVELPTAENQAVCVGSVVADLQVTTGEGISWYTAETGGTELAPDTMLSEGTYYASQSIGDCESMRIPVEVTFIPLPAAPVIADDIQTFCNNATLANINITGEGVLWYTTATGGTALPANMALNPGTSIYYASQTVNGCESSARTAVAVVLNVTASPVVENLALCGNSTVADLMAEGTNIQWYNVATGGMPLAMDAAITGGTYYASQTINGCESPRVAATVTINPVPATPTSDAQFFCGEATVADLSAEGTSIFETIFSDNFNNLNNWNVINLQGANVWAISSAGNPSNAPYVMLNGFQQNNLDWLVSDPIAISDDAIGATLKFITASNYNGPTLEVFYTTNYTGDVATTDWQTLSPTLSSGGWAWVNSGDLDVSSAIGSDLVVAFKYTSSTGSNNAKAWEIDNVQVITESYNLNWYDSANNALASTDALSTGLYYVSQTINGCESETAAIGVTVNPIPAAPVADAQMFCGSATIADIAVAIEGTATWYADANTTTALATDTALATGMYYVSQTIAGCESERTMVEVTVNEIPAAPVADAQLFCGLTTVADLMATGENLQWYNVATEGTVLLDGLVVTTGNYYVSQTVNGCESERTMVEVTVNEIPVAPLADEQLFCGEATVADLTVNIGENVTWYDVATGGTALATDAALATGTYYVSQTVNNCESPRAVVEVTVNEIPAAPTAAAQLFCGSAIVADLAVTGEMPMWYDVAIGGTALAANTALATGTYYVSQTINGCESERTAVEVAVNPIPSVPTASAMMFCGSATAADLTATTEGAAIWYANATTTTTLAVDAELSTGLYYVSQIVGGCESPRIAVSVTVNETPVAPAAEAQLFCGSATVAELSVVNGEMVMWYDVATGGTALAANAALATGTYYVSQTVNGCESERTMVEVTINETPVAPTADDFTFCGSATVADLSVTSGEMPMWYTTETGGEALTMDAALATGMYYVSQTVNGCESERTMVEVTVNPIPVAPTADALQTLCSQATVSDIEVTGNNITWYDAPTGGSVVADDMVLAQGTSIYYASQTVNGCESTRTAVAVVLSVTSVPTVEALDFCGTATVADLSVVNGEMPMWYDVATGGTALAVDAAVMTGTYYVSQTLNGCESARVAVDVTVTDITTPVGEAIQEFTAGETIADLEVDGTNVIWFSDAELTVMIETTTVLEDGMTYYAVSNSGDCASEALAITVDEVLRTAVIEDAKFTHYPNPVEDVLNIEFKENITSVTIYNVLGQMVMERSTNGTNVQVNMSTLSAGTYIVRAASDNKTTSFKVVKN